MAVNWRLQGNLKVIAADIKKAFPKATVYSVGDASHQSKASDHNPFNWGYGIVVSAIDIMIRGGITDAVARQIIKQLIGRGDIQYIIYRGKIYNRSIGNWAPRKYTGSDQHFDHVHVSATHSSAADRCSKHLVFGTVGGNTPAKKPVTAKPVVNVKAPAFPGSEQSYYGEYRGTKIPYRGGVKQFQTQLKKLGFKITDDGYFGQKTTAVVRDFQKRAGLKVDGLVGHITWSAMFSGTVSV